MLCTERRRGLINSDEIDDELLLYVESLVQKELLRAAGPGLLLDSMLEDSEDGSTAQEQDEEWEDELSRISNKSHSPDRPMSSYPIKNSRTGNMGRSRGLGLRAAERAERAARGHQKEALSVLRMIQRRLLVEVDQRSKPRPDIKLLAQLLNEQDPEVIIVIIIIIIIIVIMIIIIIIIIISIFFIIIIIIIIVVVVVAESSYYD